MWQQAQMRSEIMRILTGASNYLNITGCLVMVISCTCCSAAWAWPTFGQATTCIFLIGFLLWNPTSGSPFLERLKGFLESFHTRFSWKDSSVQQHLGSLKIQGLHCHACLWFLYTVHRSVLRGCHPLNHI